MSRIFALVLGPQDGAKVKPVGDQVPEQIFVGPKWLGDGFVAYGLERCDRFPVCYIMQTDGQYWHEYKIVYDD